DLLLFERLFRLFTMEFDQLTGAVLHFETGAVRCHAGLPQQIELLDALKALFVQFVHDVSSIRSVRYTSSGSLTAASGSPPLAAFFFRYASMKASRLPSMTEETWLVSYPVRWSLTI